MTEKVDRRIRRTEKLLGDALISLILERGFEHITIKDITERADVAYVTFFRHYKTIDDLLAQQLDTIVHELIDRLEAAADWAACDSATEGRMIFEHVEQHHGLYRILLGSPGAFYVVKHLKATIARHIYAECETHFAGIPDLPPTEIIANHVAASILALIEWWLENERPYPPERMGKIYDQLIISGTLYVVTLDLPGAPIVS